MKVSSPHEAARMLERAIAAHRRETPAAADQTIQACADLLSLLLKQHPSSTAIGIYVEATSLAGIRLSELADG